MVRVTEAAAIAAARWMGKGDAVAADQAAADAMHQALSSLPLSATIALGEGDRDTIPKLYSGETFGPDGTAKFELALDALECTKSVAFGRSNAMAVVALAPSGAFFNPPSRYLEKLAVGPRAAGVIDLKQSVQENLGRIAEMLHYSISDLTVVVLDRARHVELIERIRRTGARIHLIPDGDVAAAIATAIPGSGVDVLMGTGGATAGVLAAAALKCIGGDILTRLAPTDRNETRLLAELGYPDTKRVYRSSDLVRNDTVLFAATGITDGDILNGVCFRDDGVTTHSMVVRSLTRSRRFIVTEHYSGDIPRH
jgi:fructose-1,6-bisphosphatase II